MSIWSEKTRSAVKRKTSSASLKSIGDIAGGTVSGARTSVEGQLCLKFVEDDALDLWISTVGLMDAMADLEPDEGEVLEVELIGRKSLDGGRHMNRYRVSVTDPDGVTREHTTPGE